MKKMFILMCILMSGLLVACNDNLQDYDIIITFNANGGEFNSSKQTHVINTNTPSQIIFPENPLREGCEFDGWYWDENIWQQSVTDNSFLDLPMPCDIIVYARWINSEENPTPTTITITGNKTVNIGTSLLLTATVSDESSVTWSSSDLGVATVSEIGIVTGISLGSTNIIAASTNNPDISASFLVTVEELKPMEITITGNTTVYIGETSSLTATVSNTTNTDVTWSSSNSRVATVSETGVVTGISTGRIVIIATSVNNPNISKSVLVTVKKGGLSITYPDLQGYTITIMTKNPNEYDPFHRNANNEEDYAARDKAAKKAAFDAVKANYNCNISVIAYPAGVEWGQSCIDYINLQGTLETPAADFYIVSSGWIPDFVEGGSIVDLTEFYGTYGEDKMDSTFRQACTYKEKLYGMTNASASLINGLFYNIDLIDSIRMDTPAEMFNDDNWTYSDFKAWVLEAQSKLYTNQIVLSGHGIYYWYGMSTSSGVRVANIDNLIIDYQNEHVVTAAQTLKDIYTAGAFDPTFSYDAGSVAFNTGNAIFCPGQFWFLNADNRWATYRGEIFNIGYVPYPYADTMTKADARFAMPDEAVYAMATGRTADQESVYRAINDMFLMTRENVENAPGYDEYELRLQNAQRLTDDPESVTAIMYINDKGDNPTNLKYFYDPLESVYSFTRPDGLGPALRAIILGANYQQTMAMVVPVVEAALNRKYG